MSDVGNEVVPVATPAEAPAPEVESTADQSPAPEGETPEAPPEKTFTQAELDKIIQKRLHTESRKAEREAQQREARIQREIEERIAKAQPQTKQRDGAPQREQFQDDIAYVEALTDWKVDQKMNGYQQQTAAQREAEYERQRVAEAMPKIRAAESKYPDFAEVVSSFDSAPEPLQAAMQRSKMMTDLYYYFGSNHDELAKVSDMHPIDQIYYVKELEAKLSAAPTVTRTSAPIVPNAGKAPVKRDTFELPWNEFVAQRRKELSRK